MDNFSIYGSSFDECLVNLEKVLERCVKVNLVLNWEKCHFMVNNGIFLRYLVSKIWMKVNKGKIYIIEKLTPHTFAKEITGFLGHGDFYRQFTRNFSKIFLPLTSLLMKDVEFSFDESFLYPVQK